MGSNNLAARTDGQTVQSDDVNQYRNALINDHVPRNASGSPEASQGNLGTNTLPWGDVYLSGQIVQNGSVLDFTSYATESHKIVSGAVQTLSGYPAFLAPVGGAATGRILGATTALRLVVNTTAVTISSNVDVTGLTLAPSSGNTCLVNDASLAGQASSKLLGQHGETLTVDAVGAEISALDGTVQVFKKGSEYFLARIDIGNNRILPFMRGVCRTSRESLVDNDTLTLMAGNWIFIEGDGATSRKTRIFPTYEHSDPASPVSNQWCFNLSLNRWRQYSGSWASVDVILLGFIVCDSTQAVAAQAYDYDHRWDAACVGRFELVDDDTLRVIIKRIGVGDNRFYLTDDGQTIQLSASGDREAGVSEAANTRYYVYADESIKLRFSTTAPRLPDRKGGMYHPREYWRYLGYVQNDASSNLTAPVFNGDASDYAPAPTPYPKGYFGGLPPFWTSASTVTIPSSFMCRDSVDSTNIVFDQDTVVSISASGKNGLDTGSEAGDKWYYLYAIADTTGANAPAGILSEVNEQISGAIVMPPGFDKKRLLPLAIRNDGSGNFLKFTVAEGWPQRPTILYDVTETYYNGSAFTTGSTNIINAGAATSWTAVSAASFVPPISRIAVLHFINQTTGSAFGYFTVRPSGSTTDGQGAHLANPSDQVRRMPLNNSQQLEYRRNSGAGVLGIDVSGFIVTEV